MFEFFESDHGGINPQYWAEKLQGPGHDMARSYSHEALVARVHEWAREVCEWGDFEDVYPSLLIGAIDREILDSGTTHEQDGHERLRLLEDELGWRDTWEWDLREFDFQFLWCCWAIAWGIRQYRGATAKAAAA
jgi:hypothetical protein